MKIFNIPSYNQDMTMISQKNLEENPKKVVIK